MKKTLTPAQERKTVRSARDFYSTGPKTSPSLMRPHNGRGSEEKDMLNKKEEIASRIMAGFAGPMLTLDTTEEEAAKLSRALAKVAVRIAGYIIQFANKEGFEEHYDSL